MRTAPGCEPVRSFLVSKLYLTKRRFRALTAGSGYFFVMLITLITTLSTPKTTIANKFSSAKTSKVVINGRLLPEE